jgi:hypothetical protein
VRRNHILKFFLPYLLTNHPAQQSVGHLPKLRCF